MRPPRLTGAFVGLSPRYRRADAAILRGFSINDTDPFSVIVAKEHLLTVVQAINHWVLAVRSSTHSQKTIAARIETPYLPESSAGIEVG